MDFQDLANYNDLQKTIIEKQAATLQREKTTNTRLRTQLKLLKNDNYTEKAEVLKRLAPNYCKTVGINQGELEDRANLEKRIAEQDKEIKELKRQAQEAGETDSGTNLPAWDHPAKTKKTLAWRSQTTMTMPPAEYFSCAEGGASLLDADATPTEGMISCEQGVVKDESEEESAKEELESEIEPEKEYAQKVYGCMRKESDDCTHSDVTVTLPDCTMGVAQAPIHNAELQRLMALEQQTHTTVEALEPEG